jgi:hypothetical protein
VFASASHLTFHRPERSELFRKDVVWSTAADAHSGGTNAAGCHTNRRTGEYHCHNPKPQVPSAASYCHVVKGENRCGYARSTCEDLVKQFGGYCRPTP